MAVGIREAIRANVELLDAAKRAELAIQADRELTGSLSRLYHDALLALQAAIAKVEKMS